MKIFINFLFITTYFIALIAKINGQSDPFNSIVYTKPLPSNITVANQPNDFKFTTHLVNIKIPSDSANIWNVDMEKRYLKRMFNYIKDVDCIILNYSGFYFDESLGLGSLKNGISHHIMIQNKVQNIGLTLFNNAHEYNSNKLLGITRLTEDWGLRPQVVTHEFYHQWNSYLESAKYWLVDPSYHTGLIEDSNTVFYGQGHYWDIQHLKDSIYSYKGGACTGFPGKLEGYLAGLWDMPEKLRTLKNYYNYNLPSEAGSDGTYSYGIYQIKADGIVDLNKTQLFDLYGGERIPNYINANNNYDCAVIVFSLNDFLSDNKLKGFHYTSILNEFEGSNSEYNNLYDQICNAGKYYSDVNYGIRQTNPYHSSYKELHFNTRLFNDNGTPTIALPSKPHLVFPSTNQKDQSKDITFKWNKVDDAQKYFIQLSKDQSFGTVAKSDSTVMDTIKIISNLSEGQKYFWNVYAKNIAGISPLSDSWNFTTQIIPPSNLTLQRTGLKEITLKWNDNSNNEEGYLIERKQLPQTNYSFFDSLKTVAITYLDNKVDQGPTYSYRIKSYTKFVQSDYSNEASIVMVGVEGNKKNPTEYSLLQNYPNPFNPSTNIIYSLKHSAHITLEVFDILGRSIQKLFEGFMNAGNHEILFNGENISSGVYYYQLRIGENIFTKKMLLIK